jgi:hypothetical protein
MDSKIDTFKISQECASINFYNNSTEITFKNRWDGTLPHYGLFHRLMNYLKTIGFEVGKDPDIERDYKCLSKDRSYGISKDRLEFKAQRYPAGFKVEFFQNIYHENPHGGFYDFDKYEKMPYLLKQRFTLTAIKVRQFLLSLNICESQNIECNTAEDTIKKDYVESWHHPQKDMSFDLSSLDGQTCCEPYNNRDRDGKTLYNGQIKYFRDYNGYLCKGKVYHNINNMWWVIINDTKRTNIASFNLFDLSPSDKRGRLLPHRPPKAYNERQKALTEMSDKELAAEIRRRKKHSICKSSKSAAAI